MKSSGRSEQEDDILECEGGHIYTSTIQLSTYLLFEVLYMYLLYSGRSRE